jgi:hypothetical protein
MLGRATVAGLVAVGGLLLGPGSAAAQELRTTTWDQAAAQTRFPVWKPTRTFGLKPSVRTTGCSFGRVPEIVSTIYRKRGSRKRFALAQFFPHRCGDPDVAQVVRTVRIRGERVEIWVNCADTPDCAVTAADGPDNGFVAHLRQPGRPSARVKRARRTVVQAFAGHISLRTFVRMLRSLRPVDLSRPTVQLEVFLSSDRSVWCGIGLLREEDRWCSTQQPHHGASLAPDGTLWLCGDAQPADPVCIQNWNDSLFALTDGQRADVGGYVCVDEAGAITCTIKEGDAAGRGFRVDATGSSEVGPAP